MLAFLRSKSNDVPVDKIVDGTKKLNLHTNNDDSSAPMSIVQQCPEDLIKSLGYQNADDLKETIYGEFIEESY